MRHDIITFGSATVDIFVRAKDFFVKRGKEFITGKGICFSFPSKIDVNDICLATGGGGTNVAATFSSWGLKTAYCGKIGEDVLGKEVSKDLKGFDIDTKFLFKTRKKPTNSSVIFSAGRDRTVFVFRGSSETLKKGEIPWDKLKADWFFLAPLSGKLSRLFVPLVNFARKNKIKIACNPGNSQISLSKKSLESALSKIDILILNQEEASLLTQIPYYKEEDVFKKLDLLVPGITVMTKGKEGVVVSDGNYIFKSKAPSTKVVEKTGAGDAFGSGFVAGFIKKGNIPYAIQLGMANATSCVQEIGAKKGLLEKKKLPSALKIKVQKNELS